MTTSVEKLVFLKSDLQRLSILHHLPTPTQLLAVSKNQSISAIEELLKHGQRLFGENRVQEAQAKWPGLKALYPDCRLHLIGPLQTNKVKEAVQLFDTIETLDRRNLAATLADQFQKQQRRLPLLIQVNTGLEPQKSGIHPDDVIGFYEYCCSLDLPIHGLMCIPPAAEDPSPHFALLRVLQQRLKLPTLSMGMSPDYPDAIRHHSSWVRIGTALFGQR